MKFAVHPGTWAGYAKLRNEPFDWKVAAAEIAEIGFDGIECSGPSWGPARDVRAHVRSLGLEIAAVDAAVTANPYPPNAREFLAAARYAADLEVPTLMVCGGFIGPRRTTTRADYELFGENLNRALDRAERLGVEIAYHPHRGCIVETIAETQLLLEVAPRLRLCVDTAHLEAVREDAVKFIRRFGDRIRYTHIKDYSWRRDSFVECGKGDGALDVAACLAALRRARYDGWLTAELDRNWSKWPAEKVPTPAASARHNLRYLRQHAP